MAGHGNDLQAIPSKPMSVEQIVKSAQSYDFNPLIPLKYWLRTASTLLKEAEIYEHEGNDQQTYLLLYRHAQLVVRNLATHPHARRQENRPALAQAKRDVENGIKKLEVLKPRINKRYERYEQLIHDRDARKASSNTANSVLPLDQNLSNKHSIHTRLPSDSVISNGTETLAAGDNRDFAVKLAHKEIRRRASARKTTRQAGISEEEEQERRTAGLWGNWEEALVDNDQGINQETLRRQMQNVRLQVDGAVRGVSQNEAFRPPFEDQKFPYRYPSIPEHSAREPEIHSASPFYFMGDISQQGSALPPRPPPKNDEPLLHSEALPPRPGKDLDFSCETVSRSSASSPTFQDLKPSGFTFKPSAYLENGTPLRTIFLPPNLRHRFLSLALPNTRANLETCGVLCGTLISNALFVSKLVIPEQESTSDTCETVNESGLFDYVDGEDLMVLGWIHTHPTQTCFMSSRDLHTHCGYQVMMPESIAIVCAPSRGDWGVFRLTDPPGMKSVLNCSQTGLFHPHSESNIYTDALRPGHVYEAEGLEFEVIDLRPSR